MITIIFTSLLVISVLAYLSQLLFWLKRVSKITVNIPGPKPLPIIGNGLLFRGVRSSEDVYKKLTSLFRQHAEPKNKIAKLWLGPKLWILTSNPSQIETLLSSADASDKDDVYEFLAMLANGVFTANGERWKELRKPLNKMMHKNKIESSLSLFKEKSKLMCETLKKIAVKGELVDVKYFTASCMADILAAFSFGCNFNELENNKCNLSVAVERLFGRIIELAFTFPYCCLNVNLARRTSIARQALEEMKRYWMMVYEMVDKRSLSKTQLGDDGIYADLIIQIAKRDRLNPFETGKLACDYFVAGFDTAAITVSSALLMLAMHPEHQEALYQEQIHLLGKDPFLAPNWQQLSNMEHLTRVIKESLRLFGPIGILRKLTNDVDLGEHKIPKGCTAYILLNELHRNPEFWTHPNEFHPDHFLPEEAASRPKTAFLPFSWGPRGCPGAQFGITAAKVIISSVVRTFRLETDLKYEELKFKYLLMTEISQGYFVRLAERNIS